MTTLKKLTVPPGAKQRLDIFLVNELGVARSQAQQMIKGGLVSRNGEKPKKAGEGIKMNDDIVILSKAKDPSSPTKRDSSVVSLAQNDRLKASHLPEPKIIASTPDYVVVEKPTSMLTHPTQANEKETLVNFLIKKYPEIKKVGDDPKVRPGIVHRLDKEASGLLVVAKTQKMFNHLKEQFKNRTIEKEYFALVHGRVAKDWDEINFPIARGRTNERMAARPLSVIPAQAGIQTLDSRLHGNDSNEKQAKTEFFVEKRFVNFTLLRVTLHTGRMHQIRVHLLAYNHPLVGDPLYFQKKRRSKWDEKLGRLFLHSAKLSFIDLSGEKQTFESPLPKELEDFLKQLT